MDDLEGLAEEGGLLVSFDESQWASSSYVMCATSIDSVITLTLVLFSFTGTLRTALRPQGLDLAMTMAFNLLDLVILAVLRVIYVGMNLLVPNGFCVASHCLTFIANVLHGLYTVGKLVLLVKFSQQGAIVEHDGTQVSITVVILALIQGQLCQWVEWWMTVRYRSTLSKIITKAYSRRISDLTAYEIVSQSNRTPMDRLDRWNSTPNEPLLQENTNMVNAYQLPQISDQQRQFAVNNSSVSDAFDFQDAVSELSGPRVVGNNGTFGNVDRQRTGSNQ